MSIITLPVGIYFGEFAISQKRFDLKEVSDSTGHTAERLIAPPRWRVRMAPPNGGITYAHAGLWKTMLLKLRGGVNHLAVYDVAQPAPAGTMRGSPILSAQAVAGATSMQITNGTAFGTLKAGDWLQLDSGLGSQLVAVTADITLNGSGAGTVSFEPPLRVTYPSSTIVTWDKPVAHYKMLTDAPEWAYVAGAFLMSGFACDFMEQWT